MNLPNKLTVSRLVLTAAFLAMLFSEAPYYESISLVFFGAASLTDYFDGKIARRDHLITNFGILMDPLADKILICSAFIAFIGLGWIQSWMVVIIVAREIAITGLRVLAASQNVVLAAERFGKDKTISQIVAILSILVLHSYTQWGGLGSAIFGFSLFGGVWVEWFTEIAKWVATFLTAVSGLFYLWRNRGLYMKDL